MFREPFALLDDHKTEAGGRLYTGFVKQIRCHEPEALEQACIRLQACFDQGLHAIVLSDYEFGVAMQGISPSHSSYALRFLIFSQLRYLTKQEIETWLAQHEDPSESPSGICDLETSVQQQEFFSKIAQIKQ